MPTDSPGGMRRYDVNDPDDMAYLIATGFIWRGAPDDIELAVEYLQDHPEAVNDKVPPDILAVLDPAPPEPVAEDELADAPPAVDDAESLEPPL